MLQKFLDEKKSSEETNVDQANDDQNEAAEVDVNFGGKGFKRNDITDSGLPLTKMEASDDAVDLFEYSYSSDSQVLCSADVETTPLAMLADLTNQLQLDPSNSKVERILVKFPLACNLSDTHRFSVSMASKAECEVDHSDEEEKVYMDKLSQLIMSVNMDLQ